MPMLACEHAQGCMTVQQHTWSLRSARAPAPSSTSHTGRFPSLAARCSGVYPRLFLYFTATCVSQATPFDCWVLRLH